ncbi:hypothetical protein ES703_109309 [subsurface metagenome]
MRYLLDRAIHHYSHQERNACLEASSSIEEIDGQEFAVLRNGDGVLAVFMLDEEDNLVKVEEKDWADGVKETGRSFSPIVR